MGTPWRVAGLKPAPSASGKPMRVGLLGFTRTYIEACAVPDNHSPLPMKLSQSLDAHLKDALADPRLSQGDGANFLGVSVSTLIRWKRDDKGPKAFKLGGRVKYRLSALQEFIAQSEDSVAGEVSDHA